MKQSIYYVMLFTLLSSSCKKDKKTPDPSNPPPPNNNTEEVITTMKLYFTDSATNAVSVYGFQDSDGEGGNPGAFMGMNQSDSVFTLAADKTYSLEIILLDVTKNPVDTVSHQVQKEGKDHMIFFNEASPTGTPAATVLSGSGIKLTYSDLDAGNPQRPIGLKVKIRTYASTGAAKNSFKVTLKHQPGTKDGTFAPGETDTEVLFKVKVN